MERKFHQDDFDQFLKENADDLRMRPSGAVWEGISKELNRKKRRVAVLLLTGLTLLSGELFTWYTLRLPNETMAVNKKAATEQTISTLSGTADYALNNEAATAKSFSREEKKVGKYAAGNAMKSAPGKSFSKISSASPVLNLPAKLSETNIVAVTDETATTINRNSTAPAILLQAEKNILNPQLRINEQVSDNTQPVAATPNSDVAAAAPKPRKKRLLSWSVFATPTVSYRKLSENKTFDRPFLTPGTPPMVSALYNINNAVIHKPDLGLEFGVAAKYALTKKLKLRSGFQFNISRYDIKAFSYIPEVATIALSNGLGVDSVRAVSSYRNFNNGSVSDWLQNMYFQASLPVGLEYEVLGNKNVKWSIAGAIQPTYIIGNRSYMITADYKNYARVPWLTRHWNMNTNVETFVTFQSGKTEWHIGPQMRYQALSSFVKKYPVKENLFDFGMKVGVTIR